MTSTYKRHIGRYIKAKDQNKPHLMGSVFTQNATLEMKVDSDNIAFPSATAGLKEITAVLIRGFNRDD